MTTISTKTEEKLNLDLYDKKILFHLSQNARIPTTTLAKKLKISQPRLKYKIKRLKDNLISPTIFFNYPLLNINSYIILLEKLSKKSIEKIMKSDSIYFFMQSIGKYKWCLNILTNNIDSFLTNELKDEEFEIQPIIKTYADNYNPYKLEIKPKKLEKDTKTELKSKDYTLLKHLSKNPTNNLITIQEKSGIDRQTCKNKIRIYEKNNIIQKFRYSINVFKMGFITYLIKIKLPSNLKTEALKTIRSNNFSGFVFESYNSFTMHYLPNNHTQLFNFIESIEKINEKIQIEVMQNTEFFKVDMIPQSVIKEFESRI